MSSNPLMNQPTPELVAAYLANRLSEAEAQSFELYCIEHPTFARDVEAELALKDGLREIVARDLGGMDRSSLAFSFTSASRYFTDRRRRLLVVTAASFAICASALVLFQKRRTETPLIAVESLSQWPASLQKASRAHVTLLRTRGSSPELEAVEAGDKVLEIKLLPDLPISVEAQGPSMKYAIRITAADSPKSEILRLSGLRPAADGFLTIYVRTEILRGRAWIIRLESTSPPSHQQYEQEFPIAIDSAPSAQH